MAHSNDSSLDMGATSQPADDTGITSIDVIAGISSALWCVLIGGFLIFTGPDEGGSSLGTLRVMMAIMAIVMPIAMIWLGVLTWRTSRKLRAENRHMYMALSAMRQSYLNQKSPNNTSEVIEKKLEELATAQRQTQTALTTFIALKPQITPPETRLAVVTPEQTEGQASLALGTPAENMAPPLSVADFIRAMNFPETAEDKEGFRALRRALSDRNVSRLINAAQDILTLLSQDGIYMDDLSPDRAKPEVWRSFAKGERGRTVAPLGGVRDRSSLALASGRMKQDAIFRDAVHHFLRKFDKTFSEFEATATDEEIAALAESRTARAFMLLGRVAGTFD